MSCARSLLLACALAALTAAHAQDAAPAQDVVPGVKLSADGFDLALELDAATLRHGERSLDLNAGEWQYSVPVGDASWPDDALVELTYGPGPAPEPAP